MIYYLVFILLMTTSLMSMDMPTSAFLIKEIIDAYFVPCMTLQEMSRLKRTCKEHNNIIDTENLFQNKNSYAFHHLVNKCSYDSRTIILAHCSLTKNNQMFEFLWDKEKDLRDIDFIKYLYNPTHVPLTKRMNVYAEHYSTPEKIQKIRLEEIMMAARLGRDNAFSVLLKKILPGSGFNIWDITWTSSKKILAEWHTNKKTKKHRKKIVRAVCAAQDADLLLAIMGGCIEPRALKSVFHWSEKFLIQALIEKDAFIKNVPDEAGKAFSYYQWNHVPPSIRHLGFAGAGIR